MNGRIYDAKLGRFLQADPFIQSPYNTQSHNRYSYLQNNPLNATDPSGFFLKKLFKGVAKLFANGGFLGNILVKLFPGLQPIIQGISQIVACSIGPMGCAAFSATATIANGGTISDAFKAGVKAYVSARAFQEIGANFDADSGFFQEYGAGHIAAHGVAGGVLAELDGGKFGHGFFSAGFAKFATPAISGFESGLYAGGKDVGQAIIAAVIGGTTSEITGGKFYNGAVTAAFGNLYNEQRGKIRGHDDNCGTYPKCTLVYKDDGSGERMWVSQSAAKNFIGNEPRRDYNELKELVGLAAMACPGCKGLQAADLTINLYDAYKGDPSALAGQGTSMFLDAAIKVPYKIPDGATSNIIGYGTGAAGDAADITIFDDYVHKEQ